ncbi:MAG: hypothetical protein HZA50_13895 [Planctomycetes bacterium]|nr:hypothetical protein [Planctomycetota bacterium]
MFANREGCFNAYPVAIGIGQSRQNKLLQAVIQYRLVEELADGQWVDCSGESLEITGYHILEKRDHSLNENAIESLKASLGWDGSDPFWLQDNAELLAEKLVQVKLIAEEYEGQRAIKVQYLNPYGSNYGGVPKADDELRRNIANRLGSKFRAIAGGTSVQTPKPAGKPTPPKSAPPKPAAKQAAPAAPIATAEPPAPATMEQAWTEFIKHCQPPKWNQEATEKEWFRILAELFPGKQPDQLNGADWAIMLEQGPGKIIPF